MPNAGDFFITTLKPAHFKWGTLRHTNTRKLISGEGYLHIPAHIARTLNITNVNSIGNRYYSGSSSDNFLQNCPLKTAGGKDKISKYAKNLEGNGDLKILGRWFNHINAQPGDRIEVRFTSSTEILLTKL
ncbi:hypothetical protein GJU39_21965 [Pedobacter petrophilus]|uniref:Uncharacterized protein n=1 Tax=Pedobacter petrophilus TaxID=1908241 RepID=A0A7K0G4K9_9SPHI|nr:hypothetical protein [Pedobacter petrophilus]MRX78747.1 hypothetical protein [Pedobacter petrophilus]